MSNSKTQEIINPFRTDYLTRIFFFLGRGNSFLTGFIYFVMSFGMIYLIGFITGQLYGKNGLEPMYYSVFENISLGILAPVGAGLLAKLMKQIVITFKQIKVDKIIPSYQFKEYDKLVDKLDYYYNLKTVIIGAFVISLTFNLYNYFGKTESWLGVNGGITGIYGRIFIIFNYYMITLMIYKCVVTIWAIQQVLKLEFEIRPLHPDRCGGLKSIGQLSAKVNYFFALIIVFFSLMLIIDPFARQNMGYVVIFIVFYFLSIPFFFLPLAKAYRKMTSYKEETLHLLSKNYDYYYDKLMHNAQDGIVEIESADEIISINSMYRIAERMPVWPYDLKTISRFFTYITIPFIAFIIKEIFSKDSIVHEVFLKILF